ncbi:ABC transporter ATP-binding protein [Alicyclobacillus dauci]|uniref:ABC transporter ATP-binding protein/permease n=1 Tax=Alicyclobacillus dauci TaxID=1475485 RepID=A0ABY6Z4D0_9BACL|nr:ABC transporter ATP-binding protein [Alicyclobacillus dauci]WAH37737.1 ABC transporter ATP-binding protein/permease [Alicyclobacillus dauci]
MKKLFKYLRPYRLSISLIVLFIFLQCLCNLYLPTLMAKIVDNGVIKGDIPYIWRIGGFMLAVSICAVVLSISAGFLSSRTSSSFGRVLRSEVFAHAEQFTLHEFDHFGTSSLITRSTNDITQVQQLVNMMLRMMIMAPLNFIGGILMAVYTDARLSLVIVVMVPLLAIAIFAIFSRATVLFKSLQVKIDKLNRVLRENLTGIRVIRSFNRVDFEKRRFDDANLDLTSTTTRVQKIMATLMPLLMLIINFSTLAIIWFAGIRINNGLMQVGSLIAFIQYVMQLLFSIMMVSMMFFMIPRASASAARINEVLEKVPEIADRELVRHANGAPGTIEFRNVTFSYPGAEKPAVSNISFVARPGQVTALIGGTGSGKSTLVSLIPRFYDIDSGALLVDGIDVREQSQENLRSKIGYVPQKAILFTGTIADNIRYGKDDATDEEIKHAADIAQATGFIAEMQNGFDSFIEQGGTNVSGGQKQRLSIARVLVRRPEIYIFDDSFSALDFKTDAKLRSALKEEVSNSTVLIVAQRVSTVRDADVIIVLDEGRIAGIGKHRELLETCQVYREIVSSQLSEEESA